MYFIPKFSTIQTPKRTVPHYEERVSRSVVGEFNARWGGRKSLMGPPITFRPKVGICSHQVDYCDTCSKSKAGKANYNKSTKTVYSGFPRGDYEARGCLRQENGKHWDEHHAYNVEVTKQCSSEWAEITSLEQKATLTNEETVHLNGLKKRFNLVLSAEFQMCQLVPYWGCSAQPGCTYSTMCSA